MSRAVDAAAGPGDRPALASDLEGILACVHCGFCLSSCPTYRVLGDENDSPRGRIYLMRALVEDRVPADGAFAAHIDRCLGCRACETACPAGVEYGALLELAREDRVESGGGAGLLARGLLWVFRSPARTRAFLAAGRWLRDSGLAGRLGRWLPGRAGLAFRLLAVTRPEEDGGGEDGAGAASGDTERGEPTASGGAGRGELTASGGGAPEGEGSEPGAPPTFTLLEGCVMRGLFGHVNAATRRALSACGYREREAPGQGCCGALHAHAGLARDARELARRNVEALEEAEADVVAVNSAGCGAAMREYPRWLSGDPVWVARARRLAERVRDVSELLADPPRSPSARLAGRAAYDAPCHLLHGQGIREEPLRALSRVDGLEVSALPSSDRCCGGAGIYNLLHPRISRDVLDPKLDEVEEAGARWVVTGNPGCLMQVGAGLLERGSPARAVHPVELLDRALRAAGAYGSCPE